MTIFVVKQLSHPLEIKICIDIFLKQHLVGETKPFTAILAAQKESTYYLTLSFYHLLSSFILLYNL